LLSLFFRNLFFTILQPGIVAGLVPYLIVKEKENDFGHPLLLYHYIAIFLFMAGILITLSCIINFAKKGKGTLSPADPTKKLVIAGLYKYSRNPMYIGVMLVLIGESVFFQQINLWIYTATILIAFNLFIIFFEEPRLRKDFGTAYELYCKKTRRWI